MKKTFLLFIILPCLFACDSITSESPQPSSVSKTDTLPQPTALTEKKDSLDSLDSLITSDYLMGKFNYRRHPLFQKLPDSLANKEIYLHKEVITAFARMHQEALKDNISLTVISGTRNFEEQRSIWENKWKRESTDKKSPSEIALAILEYSSMPSTSRHHWGTDVDINSVESSYFQQEPGKSEYTWLTKNAARFGFYQTYTRKDKGRTGYSVEEWHWSYLPLANRFLERYNQTISHRDISGFTGCETAEEINIIGNYVNGIEKYSTTSSSSTAGRLD